MPAEQGEEAPGKKYPDGSGDAADDDILASELTIEELKEAFRSVITEQTLSFFGRPWSRPRDTRQTCPRRTRIGALHSVLPTASPNPGVSLTLRIKCI